MNNTRTAAFYLANLGAEVARLVSAHEAGDGVEEQHSLERARRIFLALDKEALTDGGRSEVALLKQVVEDLPRKERKFSVDAESLESYFYPFACRVLGV